MSDRQLRWGSQYCRRPNFEGTSAAYAIDDAIAGALTRAWALGADWSAFDQYIETPPPMKLATFAN